MKTLTSVSSGDINPKKQYLVVVAPHGEEADQYEPNVSFDTGKEILDVIEEDPEIEEHMQIFIIETKKKAK